MRKFLAALAVLMLLCVQFAVADDLNPPPYRGGPLSTVAEWDFLTPNLGLPDGTSVATVVGDGGGQPLATASLGLTWDLFDGTGAWIGQGPDGGTLGFEIPNWIDLEPIKFLRIQMTVMPTFDLTGRPIFPYVSNVVASDPLGIDEISQTGVLEYPLPGPDGLWQRVEDWIIRPNPDFEFIQIFIPPDALVSQVVIDTISVPEPSSVVLAGMGAAALVGAVWRRRRAQA